VKEFLSNQLKGKKKQGLKLYEKKNFNGYGGCVVEFFIFRMRDESGGVIRYKTGAEFVHGEN